MLTTTSFLSSALPVAVYMAAVLAKLTYAQVASCQDISMITIAFNESDIAPSPNDLNYVKTIIMSPRPINVTIFQSEANTMPFKDTFRLGYDDDLWGYYVYVRMIGAIDRDGSTRFADDDVAALQYGIQCSESPNTSPMFGTLKIIIEDVNDNPPVFQSNIISFSVEENLAPFSSVYQVSTTDLDEGANSQVNYHLYSMPGATFNGTGVFDIDQFTGSIFLEKELDFESMYRTVGGDTSRVLYEYSILATDNGYPALASTATLMISITDSDDLGPTFYYPSCRLTSDLECHSAVYDSSIFSNDTSGSRLTTLPVPRNTNDEEVDILAYDMDTLNASIKCSISSVTPKEYFNETYFEVRTSPVRNTGQYKCTVYHLRNKPISGERHSSVELILQVQEDTFNGRSAYAVLNIAVLEEGETLPSPTPDPIGGRVEIWPNFAVGYVNENALNGSMVSGDSLLTTDLRFRFSHTSENQSDWDTFISISQDPESPFTLTQNGYLKVSKPILDFEIRELYEFTVIITEQSTTRTSATADVRIIVLDLNDNSPVFVSSTNRLDVEEGDYSSSEESIFTFSATDADGSAENNRVTIDLTSVSPADGIGKFRLNEQGVLFVTGIVAGGNSYDVEVAATDNGTPPRRSKVVAVVDIIEPETASDDGLGTGALLGIVVAAAVIVVLAIILITCYVRRRRRDKGQGRTRSDQYVRQDVERNHELKNATSTNPTFTEKEQAYAYADGFIHKNSSNPNNNNNDASAYNSIGPQQGDEEIYCYINESEVDNTATQPNDLPENSYSQPVEFSLSNDTSYLTPSLPKRMNKSGDDSSYEQPTTAADVDDAEDSAYSQPVEAGIQAGKNPTEHRSLEPMVSGLYTECDTPDDASYLEPTEAEKNGNEHKGNGQTLTGDERSQNYENTANDKSDSTTYYDTLIPDDPNYSNLDRDHREYFRINVEEEVSAL